MVNEPLVAGDGKAPSSSTAVGRDDPACVTPRFDNSRVGARTFAAGIRDFDD